MEGREEAPGCSPDPPDLSAAPELLRHLLAVELERLEVAHQIERERRIVFPETTVIIRDIQKLRSAIDAHERGEDTPEPEEEDGEPDPLDALLRDL